MSKLLNIILYGEELGSFLNKTQKTQKELNELWSKV